MGTVPEALAAAVAHQQAGRLQEAEQIYWQLLAADPNNAGVWHLLGAIAYQLERLDIAVKLIGRAVQLAPLDARLHNSLGATLEALGKLDEAAASLRRALELEPNLAVAHYNFGIVCRRRGQFDEAIACYQRALDLKPGYPEACNNIGVALKSLGREAEAAEWYRRAIVDDPNNAAAHTNLGLVLCSAGQLVDAAWHYRRAIELTPDYAWAHWNQSLLLLLTGELEHGWSEYEWRWKAGQVPLHELEQPKWAGDSLAGRTILLHTEQGLGDTIQFVRYAALLKERGAKVIVECQPVLEKLLAGCHGVDQLVAAGNELPPFDVHLPLLSLPKIFETTLKTIPANVPYLMADSRLVAAWRKRLSALDGFRIGINWRGSNLRESHRNRDIPLNLFSSLADIPGVRLISLQKGASREELAGISAVDLGEEIDTANGAFVDTAAIMMNLDLVITCDTSVAHLAGALGVPVWVALPFVPDWRWLLDRSDSPWYPTMRLFRQKSLADWDGVFKEITAALRLQITDRQGPAT